MDTDQIKDAFIVEKNETQNILSLISGYNRRTLTEEESEKLDEWITRDDFNERLFVMLTDKTYAPVLREIVNSLNRSSNSL
jgi:hypothetical protein